MMLVAELLLTELLLAELLLAMMLAAELLLTELLLAELLFAAAGTDVAAARRCCWVAAPMFQSLLNHQAGREFTNSCRSIAALGLIHGVFPARLKR
jgi:hypothetical protein